MTKLKTLKDLPLIPIDLDRDELYEILKKCNFDNTEVFRERAKQEAIKIKKTINGWHKKGILHKKFEELSGFKRLNVDTFMKWLFNFTEEELK